MHESSRNGSKVNTYMCNLNDVTIFCLRGGGGSALHGFPCSVASPVPPPLSLVVRLFKALERSPKLRSQSKDFVDAIEEYLDMGRVELVPVGSYAMKSTTFLSMQCVKKRVLLARFGSCWMHLLILRPAHHYMIVSSLDLS